MLTLRGTPLSSSSLSSKSWDHPRHVRAHEQEARRLVLVVGNEGAGMYEKKTKNNIKYKTRGKRTIFILPEIRS